MTLPYERTRAVNHTYQFLLELCDPTLTPRVPRKIREQARALLRHYPTGYDMERISRKEDQSGDPFGRVFGVGL